MLFQHNSEIFLHNDKCQTYHSISGSCLLPRHFSLYRSTFHKRGGRPMSIYQQSCYQSVATYFGRYGAGFSPMPQTEGHPVIPHQSEGSVVCIQYQPPHGKWLGSSAQESPEAEQNPVNPRSLSQLLLQVDNNVRTKISQIITDTAQFFSSNLENLTWKGTYHSFSD